MCVTELYHCLRSKNYPPIEGKFLERMGENPREVALVGFVLFLSYVYSLPSWGFFIIKEKDVQNGIQGRRNISEPGHDLWPMRSFFPRNNDKRSFKKTWDTWLLCCFFFFFPNVFFPFFFRALFLLILPCFWVSFVRLLSSIQIRSHSPAFHHWFSSICSLWIILFIPMTNTEIHDFHMHSINPILFSKPDLPLLCTLTAFR